MNILLAVLPQHVTFLFLKHQLNTDNTCAIIFVFLHYLFSHCTKRKWEIYKSKKIIFRQWILSCKYNRILFVCYNIMNVYIFLYILTETICINVQKIINNTNYIKCLLQAEFLFPLLYECLVIWINNTQVKVLNYFVDKCHHVWLNLTNTLS